MLANALKYLKYKYNSSYFNNLTNRGLAMIKPYTANMEAESLQSKTINFLDQHREKLRKQAETVLSQSGAEVSGMSDTDLQKLLVNFQVHHIQLELQSEELRRTYHELSASCEHFAQLYNLSPAAYLTTNEQGIIQKANISAINLLDCPQEQIIGKELGQFMHPLDQHDYCFFIRSLVATQAHQVLNSRLNIRKKPGAYLGCQGINDNHCPVKFCEQDNEFIDVECRGAVNYNDKNELQIFLTINDITERKHTQEGIFCLNEKLEEKILQQTRELIESNQALTKKIEELKVSKQQLQEREAKLNSIFNASVEGIITINRANIIVSVNAAVETIFGYTQEELIGCNIIKLIPLSQSKKNEHPVNFFLCHHAPKALGQIQEVEGVRKNGSIVPLDLSIAEFTLDGISYFTSILRDISSRKHQEQQNKEHLDELAHVTRLGLMGEMGSGIAHEINQPLTAIVNYTQACLNFIDVENPDLVKISDILHKTHKQALTAGLIIHRMRDFVKSQKIHRLTTDINMLIYDAVGLCAGDFKENNITPTFELAKNLPVIVIDNVQIEQVLINLFRNSVDALKNLSPKTQRLLLIQTHQTNHRQIKISIRDNGSGIEQSQQQKIFTPFFTTKSTGMGMGLSISRSIVEAHNGVLRFTSSPEKGTTFYFTLPC